MFGRTSDGGPRPDLYSKPLTNHKRKLYHIGTYHYITQPPPRGGGGGEATPGGGVAKSPTPAGGGVYMGGPQVGDQFFVCLFFHFSIPHGW